MEHGTADEQPASETPAKVPGEVAAREILARLAALSPNQRFFVIGCLFPPGMARALAWAVSEDTFDNPDWEKITRERLQVMLPAAGWAQFEVACREALNEDAPEDEAPPPSGGGEEESLRFRAWEVGNSARKSESDSSRKWPRAA